MKTLPLTNVRWRIAALSVGLSSILYITLAFLGMLSFSWNVSKSMEDQLRFIASELGHAIEVEQNTPHFRDWLRVVQTDPARSLAAIELYDGNKKLLEHYGPEGPRSLSRNSGESGGFQIIVSPLTENGRLVGYLQIAWPIRYRQEVLQKLTITITLLAPVLLLGLGITSYVVSDVATAPIENNLRLLKQFVADASHELNTPISILQARSELLEKRLKKAGLNTDDLEPIGLAIIRMEKIVGDLMLLAEIEGTRGEDVQSSLVRFDELVREAIEQFAPKFEAKGLQLKTSVCEQASVRMSDESLNKIICNLIENAWRYTEPPGSVTVSLTATNTSAVLEVADTGIGIPKESLPFIFDRFYRVDKSRSRESGGSGLGLAIVKALVDSHKGQIKVRSKIGEGSSFTVILPLNT